MTTDYATTPASPLPLDTVDPKSAYELMNKDSLPTQVKELIASVDSAISSHLSNGTKNNTISEEESDEEDDERFCKYHHNLISKSSDTQALRHMWILQRDISVQLFKMMMGLVRSASDLARRKRESERGGWGDDDVDLELAFHGDARGAYQWLNCLAKDECEWVWASIVGDADETLLEEHCPACLLGRAIDSESSIRLLIAAASLSNWDFFVTSLRQHLDGDAWWGSGYWETIAPKAATLELQIRELMRQCAVIRQNQNNQSTRHLGEQRRRVTEQILATVTACKVTHGNALRIQKMLSPKMKVDFDALHAFLSLQMPRTQTGRTRDLAKFDTRSADMDEYRLAVYCWFVLMLGISSETSGSMLSPIVKELIWKSRVKTRSKTVTW